jgi:hypothetical protein
MKKVVLTWFSILAVVLLVLGSQANVVGYQTVQSSVKERLNQKDLLFQTICDLANNKEVQKAILESQGKFQNPFPASQLTSFPTITKRQLNFMYFLGVVLYKTMGKARISSLTRQYPEMSIQTKDKIDAIIGKDAKLSKEILQLSESDCHCYNETGINYRPVACFILFCLWLVDALLTFAGILGGHPNLGLELWFFCISMGDSLQCKWYLNWPIPPE